MIDAATAITGGLARDLDGKLAAGR